ncbi:MAG: SIMPL domain-containing protein [Selenomonas sp.]|jgi:uncharacterized protein YggE|nr:SIMPL domain-containing protein [Selenomonas sp.]
MLNLKRLALVFGAIMMLAVGTAAAAENVPARPLLSVDGQGTGTATPDIATVTIGVVSHASDAGKAQNDNAWKSDQINKAVKGLGIDSKDIQTNNYSFQPTYQMNTNHKNEINGYTVNNSIIVVVRNIKLTGKVIDAALQAGANEINSLDFSASNTRTVRKEALSNAVQDARDKADIIAQNLGKRIVGIQNVSESTGYMESRRFNNAMLMSAKGAADTAIEPGSLSLSARVHVDFILSD